MERAKKIEKRTGRQRKMSKKQRARNRIFSVLLSLTLLCSLLSDSILVFAEEERVVYISSVEDLIREDHIMP